MSDNGKAFVVDDDAAVRDSLQSLLELEGFDVSAYATTTEFLAAIDTDSDGIVLLDVNLPDGLGHLLRRGRTISPAARRRNHHSFGCTAASIRFKQKLDQFRTATMALTQRCRL